MAVSNFMASSNKNANLLLLFSLTVLCTLSYLIGVSHHGSAAVTTTLSVATPQPCILSTNLDFAARHTAETAISPIATAARIINVPPCDFKYSEYTPCEDLDRSLRYPRKRLMYRERHCPTPSEALKCRIPAPFGYRVPVRWPESRDSVWFANVPHKELTVEKAGQNWVRFEGNRFRFPGGGTMFPKGADAYIDDIGNVVNFTDGSIRTAIDTGCGVASWGAYLLKRNVLTMSFAPKDTHEAQVQFALERGLPAMIGILASKRLPYPSRAFDMAHCSRCLIPWGEYDGLFLIEIDRILRPGGFWILSGPPINWERHSRGWKRSVEDLRGEQSSIETVAKNLCWKKVFKRGDIAIWQKPTNHIHCKINRKLFKTLPFCNVQQDPDMAWYTEMEACLTPLPDTAKGGNIKEVAGGELEKWPQRLNSVPPRVKGGSVNGISEEMFLENSDMWERRVVHYKSLDKQLAEKGRYRNLLDMNCFLGGFAAALIDDPVWVMNVVPVEAEINTLGAIYERGLIGTYQNWCEAMSTYPRTYDFIHADSIFTLYKDRCEMEDVLLEMDRVLRPEGSAILRDDVDVLVKVKNILDGMQWESGIVDHEDGPLEREKILVATKLYWTSPNQESS